jgi:hypothetical protein
MSRIPLPGVPGESFFSGMSNGSQMIQRLLQDKRTQQQLAIQQAAEERAAQFQPYQIQQQNRLAEEFELKKQLHPYELQKAEQQKNMFPLEYKALEAKINAENERAAALKKYGSQRPSAAVQEALMIYGDPSAPGFNEYLFNKNKLYNPTEQQMAEDEQLKLTPEYEQMQPHLQNAIPMNNLGVGTQSMYRKQMNEELGQIDKAKQVVHAIAQARELTAHNPGLYKKAINIIANPEGTPGKIEKALTAFLPEEEVSAFMAAHKLYADILTKQAQLNNMSRSVYALKLQQQAKPQVKNPDEVNEQIFKNIEHEIGPQLAREKALLYAMKHNQYLPYTKKYGFEGGEPNQIPSKVHGATPMDMMKGIDAQGNEVNVHPSRRAQFEKSGGRIL